MMDRYCVMGNPIAHSKSPNIHAMFAEQTKQALIYDACLVELGGFSQALDRFQEDGGKGLNITVPFKQDAWAAVTNHSERAELAGAVNTIVLDEAGGRFGDNTDGIGMVRDITQNHAISIANKRVLLLGAGGASRGVVGPLLEENPAVLVVANRTVSKAEDLVALFSTHGPISACGFGDLQGEQFDLIINGTSASLQGELPPLPDTILTSNTCCYDMMYANQATPFMSWGIERGVANAVDGLGMLVEQAAEAFYLWRGVRPSSAPVIAALR